MILCTREKERPNEKYTLTEVLLDRLKSWDVDIIFVVPGIHLDPILLKVAEDGFFQIVMAAHEQGAGYMAEGYARISGKPGIVMTINGPGALNLTTAAMTARVERYPVLFITGDSPSFVKDYGGFQSSDQKESNSAAILRKAAGISFTIQSTNDLLEALDLFENSLNDTCPGPMHINFPNDIAKSEASSFPEKNQNLIKTFTPISKDVASSDEILPVPSTPGNKAAILAGNEIRTLAEAEKIAAFSRAHSIPVGCTLEAKNLQPVIDKELYLGVFGYAGDERALRAFLDPELETLIIWGAALNERNTVAWHPDFFNGNRSIVRISCDRQMSRKYPVKLSEKYCGISESVAWLQELWAGKPEESQTELKNRIEWNAKLQNILLTSDTVLKPPLEDEGRLAMSGAVSLMNRMIGEEALFFVDSGDHRIYGSMFWDVKCFNSFHTAATVAPMGWAIAAAVGASFANEEKQIFVLTGDGCMLMHGMEIAVAARYHRRVIFLVSNNGSYGRILARMAEQPEKQRQILSSLPKTSWTGFAESMDIPARCVFSLKELSDAISEAQRSTGPFLIEMMTKVEKSTPCTEGIFSSSSPDFYESWGKTSTSNDYKGV